MNMIALRISQKLLIFKSLVLNVALILKLLLIAIDPLLLILMFLKEIGTSIMSLLKTLARTMKLLLIMIVIHVLKPLKVLFLISMLIFLECIDLVKRLIMKKNIVNFINMRKLEFGVGL